MVAGRLAGAGLAGVGWAAPAAPKRPATRLDVARRWWCVVALAAGGCFFQKPENRVNDEILLCTKKPNFILDLPILTRLWA